MKAINRQRFDLSGFVPVTLLSAHTVAVLWVGIWVATIDNPSEGEMVWLLFMVVDIPSSLAVGV